MPIYSRIEIGRVAQENGFVRDTFEKVLRLIEILKFFNEEEFLKEHLVLKGGTAINLTIFDLPRLSVDIDMDYMPNDSKEDMLKSREKITSLIKQYMKEEGYQLSENSRFMHSLDAFYYNYYNTGGNKDMIKIELNYSLRAHVLETVESKIIPKVFSDDNLTIRTIHPIEIFAAKGNALISRAAARDLYDWGNMIEANLFEDEKDLFRKCFIFYTTISSENFNMKFDISAIDSLSFAKIRRDLFPVLKKKDNFDLDKRIKQAKEYISKLMIPSEKEYEYMEYFMLKEFKPQLLFDNEEIIEQIKKHPMAIWKCRP